MVRDFLIFVCQLALTLFAVPIIWSVEKPPVFTSCVFSLALLIIGVTLLTVPLILGGVVTLSGSVVWAIIAYRSTSHGK